MKHLLYSLAFVIGVTAGSTTAFAQQSGNLRIEFQGPGGHSSGAYGRVSALHAAAREVILIQQALPAGSYQITNLTGVSAPYERPSKPEITIATDTESVATAVSRLVDLLKARGIV